MRLILGALACVGIGGLSVALADAPTSSAPSPAPAAAAPTATAATSTSSVTASTDKPAAPEANVDEKHFLAEGYKLEMRHGEKYFCRSEEVLGSRLGGGKVCSTAQQLNATERDARASLDRSMMQQHNPAGH